ncbi:hypothetical protein PCASD_14742 [Puccinia coronata f. sp. avenae]|uniref:Uncharacterized protein n=1 Tax=Puccinia coronata f. sp. avenae TaxID=200324 RepID=A0A2N5UB33_9BASI|nr:hypothetical protein PCASD_14742 [Puccinia coronata f. sp. avenae]
MQVAADDIRVVRTPPHSPAPTAFDQGGTAAGQETLSKQPAVEPLAVAAYGDNMQGTPKALPATALERVGLARTTTGQILFFCKARFNSQQATCASLPAQKPPTCIAGSFPQSHALGNLATPNAPSPVAASDSSLAPNPQQQQFPLLQASPLNPLLQSSLTFTNFTMLLAA